MPTDGREDVSAPPSRTPPPVVAFAALAALEVFTLIALLMLHRRGDRAWLLFAARPPGIALAGALAAATATSAIFAARLIRSSAAERRGLMVGAVANAFSVCAAFAVVEIGVRALAKGLPGAPTFAGIALLPRSWPEVSAHGRAVLSRANAGSAFLVADESLGWTNGASRSSGDYNRKYIEALFPELARRYPRDYPQQLYASSVEGIRSARVGEVLADTPARRRVAAVGDSFTFGLEAPFEHTWTRQLEVQLGEGVQVLNFGVDGYGVDQSFLRYRRDVVPWKPDVVILGAIADDTRRSTGVYGFLTFPGSEIPFAKPRFVLEDGRLRELNQPLPAPAFLFSRASIEELPYLDYDRSYDASEWRSHFYDRAYALRLLFSLYPRWRPPPPASESESLNLALLRAFVDAAHARGSFPLVVVLPTKGDFNDAALKTGNPLVDLLDSDEAIPHVYMLDCLRALPPDDRFLALHYTSRANDAIASCLRYVVAEALAERNTSGGPQLAHE